MLACASRDDYDGRNDFS